MIKTWLTKRRPAFLNWSAIFFAVLGGAAIAKFFFDERSLAGEWQLIATQLGVILFFAFPAGFLISGLSRGCIVCPVEKPETEE